MNSSDIASEMQRTRQREPALSVGEKLPASQAEVLTEDLATFLVAHHILISRNESIASIKEYFQPTPDIFGMVDDILFQLEAVDLISIVGDKISFKKRSLDIGGDPANLAKFLPRLFKLSTDRLLSNAQSGNFKTNKDGLRYFVIPNTPEIAAEAKSLYLEYKSKMLALVSKTEQQAVRSDGIRLVGIFNCALNPEDFV